MSSRLSVYAEVLPSWLGRAMYRINHYLRAVAPEWVSFTTDPASADLQVLDVIGVGSLEHLKVRRHVVLQHCILTTERPSPTWWLPLFRSAVLVMSYHDLYGLTGHDDFAFYRAPWGVDGDIFRDLSRPRPELVITSGYEPSQEAILECDLAAFDVLGGTRGGVIHIGPCLNGSRAECHLDITDRQLVECYNRCRYVSGLRRGEGFELPVLEGLACGVRPVCFDTASYRDWFDGHAVFVPELPAMKLVDALAAIFRSDPDPVSEHERSQVLGRFGWDQIFGTFWQRVLELL